MFWCIIICWAQHPLYPSFYMPRGVGFTKKIRVGYNIHDHDSISACLFYKIYLLNAFLNCLGQWASSPGSLG
jgi:hypothetical protein